MGEFYSELPSSVQHHIKGITHTSGLPDGEESFELMAEAWLAKKEAFERETTSREMEEVESHSVSDERGALILTYSGSLINIGSLTDEGRFAEYTSIGLRSDVPDSAEHNSAKLAKNIEVDSEVEFTEGPVTKSSAVYKIAVCSDDIALDEQEETLSSATIALTQEFADINKTLIID